MPNTIASATICRIAWVYEPGHGLKTHSTCSLHILAMRRTTKSGLLLCSDSAGWLIQGLHDLTQQLRACKQLIIHRRYPYGDGLGTSIEVCHRPQLGSMLENQSALSAAGRVVVAGSKDEHIPSPNAKIIKANRLRSLGSNQRNAFLYSRVQSRADK